MEIFIGSIKSGWYGLLEYLSAHVLTCLVPAFFIAGARRIIIVDGCPVKCASQIVSKFTDKKPDLDIQIIEKYGIEKIPEPTFKKEDVGRIVRDIEEKTKAL